MARETVYNHDTFGVRQIGLLCFLFSSSMRNRSAEYNLSVYGLATILNVRMSWLRHTKRTDIFTNTTTINTPVTQYYFNCRDLFSNNIEYLPKGLFSSLKELKSLYVPQK